MQLVFWLFLSDIIQATEWFVVWSNNFKKYSVIIRLKSFQSNNRHYYYDPLDTRGSILSPSLGAVNVKWTGSYTMRFYSVEHSLIHRAPFFSTPKYFSNIQTQSHTPMARTQGSISSPTILCHVDRRSQGVDPLEGWSTNFPIIRWPLYHLSHSCILKHEP